MAATAPGTLVLGVDGGEAVVGALDRRFRGVDGCLSELDFVSESPFRFRDRATEAGDEAGFSGGAAPARELRRADLRVAMVLLPLKRMACCTKETA